MAGSEATPPRRYRVELRPAARRELRKVDPRIGRRIVGAIELLAQDPRPPASRRPVGRPDYRVRVGDYRIVYRIEDDVLLVLVIRIGHRRDVYER